MKLKETKNVLENPESMVTIISTRQFRMLFSYKVHNLLCAVSTSASRALKKSLYSMWNHVNWVFGLLNYPKSLVQ